MQHSKVESQEYSQGFAPFTSLTGNTPGFIFVCHNKEGLTVCRAELRESEVKSSSCVVLLICGPASKHGGQSARLRHGTLSVLAHKTPLAVGDNRVGHSLGWPMPSSGFWRGELCVPQRESVLLK